ncbi:MAG TPA: serine/threonine-protein kinase [Noviherbaspirillum sp.]|jgi:serine/threonine-protein kinase|uniref:serine/threonine-protein kinase n=1 Tax=Noviherbaspirillum sp. TaxID=1926288 RepID=UPI002F9341FE
MSAAATPFSRPGTQGTPLHRIGRFSVQHELGRGSTGCVYLGHDPVVGRDVAIKTVNPRLNGAEKSRVAQQLINEARVAGRLSHHNIVTIYEASSEGGMTYIAMEYLQGRELSRLLAGGRRYEPHEVASIGWRLADALDHAHRHEVIHRDIKPANIYMVKDLQPKLIDFGIGRAPNRLPDPAAAADESYTLVGDHQLLGTPNYMSPEQAQGHPVDARTDIYSLGAVMYEMLTGRKPFHAENADKLLQQIAYKAPPPAHEVAPGIPLALSRIVMRAMSKRAEKRYQTAERMALDIRRYLQKERRSQRLLVPVETADRNATQDGDQSPVGWVTAGVLLTAAIAGALAWLLVRSPA